MANHFLHLSTSIGCLFFATCCEATNQQASSTVPVTSNVSQGELDAALLKASEDNDYEGAKAALDAGASPNAIKSHNASALQFAVRHRDNKIFTLLIERGAKNFEYQFSTLEYTYSVLCDAIMHDNFVAADILRSHGANLEEFNMVMRVAEGGSIKAMGYLVSLGEDLNNCYMLSNFPLNSAFWRREGDEGSCLEMIEFMLSKGADIKCEAAQEDPPLNYAAEKNFLRVAKLLLEQGADPTDAFDWATTSEMKALLEQYRR